jgi:hypothetical protein
LILNENEVTCLIGQLLIAMISCKKNRRFSVNWILWLVFWVIQRLDAAAQAQLPIEGQPDLDPEKTLAALVQTEKTHCSNQGIIDHNLRNKIAAFAAPKLSREYPINFLTCTTVIPQEWGMVHDMRRDERGNLKVLTVQRISNDDAILGECIVTTGSLFAALINSKILFAASVFLGGLLQVRKYLKYYGVRISVYDLPTRTLESTYEGLSKDQNFLCYFLANTNTFEIRHTGGYRHSADHH